MGYHKCFRFELEEPRLRFKNRSVYPIPSPPPHYHRLSGYITLPSPYLPPLPNKYPIPSYNMANKASASTATPPTALCTLSTAPAPVEASIGAVVLVAVAAGLDPPAPVGAEEAVPTGAEPDGPTAGTVPLLTGKGAGATVGAMGAAAGTVARVVGATSGALGATGATSAGAEGATTGATEAGGAGAASAGAEGAMGAAVGATGAGLGAMGLTAGAVEVGRSVFVFALWMEGLKTRLAMWEKGIFEG